TVLEGLTFKTTVSMDRRWVHKFEFLDPVRTSYGRTQKGSAADKRTDDLRMIYDNILTYDKAFGKHSLQVMGGTSATTSRWESLSGTRTHFSSSYDNALIGINGGNKGGLRGQESDVSEWAIMPYLGRITYNYDSKYLLTANFRSDGSSKLAPKHRWGYFPSFSGAWRMSAESFMEEIEWINDLKIRAGWGQTGNQSGLSDYAYIQRYKTNYYDWTDKEYADSTPTVGSKDNIKNESLTWETTTQTNIGLDLTVLNNRLTLGVDLYYKYTKNMLMEVPLPAPNPKIIRNEGEMSNKGLEIVLQSRNFTGPRFNWDTDFNISFNRNKLEKLDLQQTYYYGSTSDMVGSNSIRMVPGQPLSMFWGYVANGVDPETGLIIYQDVDGDGMISSADKTWIGNANPKFTFGMTNNFSYKGFNLNILINGSYGNDIFNATKVEMIGMGTTSNQTTEVLRRWRIPGQFTDIPKSNEPYNNRMSSRWIENGSYLKVKNITLSYDIKASKLKDWKVSRLQPYVTMQNFFTITKYSGYDPEVSQWSDATSMGVDWGYLSACKDSSFRSKY
ncbi:MAG: SusC/RagA family TonB-linked outer membrane protein, partial [Tannerellaceae bacterium]|nr:SusC/RagA family TonB-linked outer membrane protein [Tannerellaceae bacterium]